MITNSEVNIILGPPGTGKTTRLLDIMEEEFIKGCNPDKMVYCSFSKKAVEEAIDRTTRRFKFSRGDLPYFRTIHSLAFHSMGLRRDNVMDGRHYKKLGLLLGVTFSDKNDPMADLFPGAKHNGDRYVFIDSYSRARGISAREVWDSLDNFTDLHWWEYQRFVDTVAQFKKKHNLVDFSDMLDHPPSPLDIEVAIIDEAQDLSTAQWKFISNVISRAKRVYIAGDDDQAIFNWSGADVSSFLRLRGKREILSQSYRIPKAAHKLAGTIAQRIYSRNKKQYKPRDVVGSVQYWNDIDHVDFTNGTWLLLVRNNFFIKDITDNLKGRGLAYAVRGQTAVGQEHVQVIKNYERWRRGDNISAMEARLVENYMNKVEWNGKIVWHQALTKIPLQDREYYISLLRRGESLSKNPRINVSTIHGIKGGEADHVMLLSDMTPTTHQASLVDPDSEHRVWYVATTRCKENLHIIMPQRRFSYQL